MPNDDLRNDLSAAFDAVESAPEPSPAPEPVNAPSGASEPPGPVSEPGPSPQEPGETAQEARARDEKGRFAPKGPDAPAKPQEAPAKPQGPADFAPPAPVAPTPPVETIKPPQSWKPAIREHFAKLPVEVQQEVIRREREVEQTQRESAQARQEAARFRETIAPFEHMIRAEGADPYKTVSGLMQTAMALASGAPGTKTGIVANLIRHYGIDVNMLANALEGQPMPQEAMREPPRDPRVDQLLAQVEQAKAQRQQALAAEAQRLIGEIQAEEFFPDVKDAMADILEVAAKRGVAMTPREAYNRAVWADPHVASVLEQRRAAAQAGNPRGSTQRAVAAASSVRGSPAGVAPAPQPQGLRGDVEAALDRLSNQ